MAKLATKEQTLAYIRAKLSDDKLWAERAIIRIFERQTATEQAIGATTDANGIGFSGCDAEFMSSLAKQLMSNRQLTERQWMFAHRKIAKYSRQVMSLIPAEKLEQMRTVLAQGNV